LQTGVGLQNGVVLQIDVG